MNKHFRIEFVGVPGSGKTTIAKKLGKEVNIRQKYELISSGLGAAEINNFLKFFLRFDRLLGKPLRLYDTWAYEVIKQDPSLQQNFSKTLKTFYNFLASETEDSLQLPLIARSLERDLIFNELCTQEDKNYINDDGVFQRLVSIFGVRFNNWDSSKADIFQKSIIKLLSEVTVIVVNSPTDLALSRLMARHSGLPDLLKKNGLKDKLVRSEEYLKHLQVYLRKSDIRMISIDSESKVDLSIEKIIRELSSF